MNKKKEEIPSIRIRKPTKEELRLQLIEEKFEREEELTEEELEILKKSIPTQEQIKKMTESQKALFESIRETIIEPHLEMSRIVSENIDTMMKPLQNTLQGIANVLKPTFEEIDRIQKENPLTRKEIEEGNKFLQSYVKDHQDNTYKILDLTSRQGDLLRKIFNEMEGSEEDILKYKLTQEEIDLPSNIFEDISKKLQGKTSQTEVKMNQYKLKLQKKISKALRDKIQKLSDEEEVELTPKEKKQLEEIEKQIQEDILVFKTRPSRRELESIDIDREIKKQKAYSFILYGANNLHFENITEEHFKEYLQEEIEILREAIELSKKLTRANRTLLEMFSRSSNSYFQDEEGNIQKNKLLEEDSKLKEEYHNTIFALIEGETNSEKLFRQIFVTQSEKKDIELEERFVEFLREDLLDLEDIQKEWSQEQEEVVEEYIPISTKNKLMSQEKIVAQVMLSGQSIRSLFNQKEEGKIEKVTFDLSGDSKDKYLVHFLMSQYKTDFTADSFKTLESLMTIQHLLEKNFGTLKGKLFSTKDIIFLNKGGRVTNYSKDLLQKTNKEIVTLMSAIGSLDTTEYFFKYYNIDDDTIVQENEEIFKSSSIQNDEQWEKKVQELRKEKMKKEGIDFPFDKIKKISTLQPFVNLKGINIESDEEILNNTLWKFNDIDERPIPLFEFLKITKRVASLPLEMDSYLTDSTINNEITRNLKSIIANLNYYKTNSQMKKDKTTRNFLSFYYEGILEGETKRKQFEYNEASVLIEEGQLKNYQIRYKTTRKIDSIAKDCKFDEERGIGIDKEWKNKQERPRFIDSIVDYLRKAREDKNIVDFILYTIKDKIVEESDYITENERRTQKKKDQQKGMTKKRKQTKNPTIEKISIIN